MLTVLWEMVIAYCSMGDGHCQLQFRTQADLFTGVMYFLVQACYGERGSEASERKNTEK